MAHTYFQLLYHLVWSTKNRTLSIPSSIEERLYEYLAGALKMKGCSPIQIGGMSDHIHILVAIPPTIAVTEVIRNVKVATTKWIRQINASCVDFSWQEGYGAFSVSASSRDTVMRYIQNQKEHHKGITFKDEFLTLLQRYNVEYDEKYFWK